MEFAKLCKIRDAYKEREQLKEKILEFEQMRISPRAAVYGSERVQSSARGDVQPDNLARLEELLRVYNAKLEAITKLVAEFEHALEALSGMERRILRMYYVDCMTWEQICVAENKSWMTIHRFKNNAYETICPDYVPKNKQKNSR